MISMIIDAPLYNIGTAYQFLFGVSYRKGLVMYINRLETLAIATVALQFCLLLGRFSSKDT
jgi:hypothetical protein